MLYLCHTNSCASQVSNSYTGSPSTIQTPCTLIGIILTAGSLTRASATASLQILSLSKASLYSLQPFNGQASVFMLAHTSNIPITFILSSPLSVFFVQGCRKYIKLFVPQSSHNLYIFHLRFYTLSYMGILSHSQLRIN